ncbi:hypothetical protein PTMSG1_10263 [Pyrenophora teres f. maculata]|nr:hypothetical protein PTMSG1_10263 [Pyrenophora teres f. maculata]
MQIDTPAAPPAPPIFAASSPDEAVNNDGVVNIGDNIFKIEDFLRMNDGMQKLARDAKVNATPTSKKMDTNNTDILTPLTPIAVGARSSKNTILLHEKYQALGIPQPAFTYGGSSTEGWNVSVSFPGLQGVEELQGLGMNKMFNSKQEAKEAVSEKALAVLEELEREGRVTGDRNKTKKSNAGNTAAATLVEDEEPDENWIGQLLEFQRSISAPQPTYTDYASGTRFACLLTLENHPSPFGSLDALFSSKKSARRAAARAAVMHFKDQGIWPDDFTSAGGIRKKKTPPTQPQQQQQSTTTDTTTPTTPPPPRRLSSTLSPSTPGSNSGPTYAYRVATLARDLALPTPEWHFTHHPSDPTFHTVSCFFKDAGPHAGPIGEVRNVYGKKKAKEECARLTLEYLERVRGERLEFGRRVLESLGRGDGGKVKGVLGDGDGESDEDEDDEMFEDAVEGL